MKARTGLALVLSASTLAAGCGGESRHTPISDQSPDSAQDYNYQTEHIQSPWPRIRNVSGHVLKLYNHAHGGEIIGNLPAGSVAVAKCVAYMRASAHMGAGPNEGYHQAGANGSFYYSKLETTLRVTHDGHRAYLHPMTAAAEGALDHRPHSAISPKLERLTGGGDSGAVMNSMGGPKTLHRC